MHFSFFAKGGVSALTVYSCLERETKLFLLAHALSLQIYTAYFICFTREEISL